MHCPSVAQRTPVYSVAILFLLVASPVGLVIFGMESLGTSSKAPDPSSGMQHAPKSVRSPSLPLYHPSSEQTAKLNQLSSGPPAVWDEQIGLTFAQDLPALTYNVTAVAQTDNNSYGPAYLLNGLSDKGYWYQVGLSYNWPLSKGGYLPGFTFAYEVFNTSGSSVFPTNGDGGELNYSGAVHPGDLVLLSLHFSSGQVVMYSKDWNTSAAATESFASFNGGIFVGLATSSNSNGFFSGLMTEEYHASPYYGSEARVIYGNPNLGINAATMWADEWNPSTNQSLFGLSGPEISYTNPSQFQYFSLNGTQEASNAYYFVTGSYSLYAVTLSYSISGGGTGFSIPKLNFTSVNGNESVSLTAGPSTYFMVGGSTWTANSVLEGSNATQRWISAISTGNVTGNSKMNLSYLHQYFAVFEETPANSGNILPVGSGWFAANTSITISAKGISPFLFVKWVANTTKITLMNALNANTTLTILGPGSVDADFALIAVTLSKTSGAAAQGSQITVNATITGPNGAISLSVAGLPAGATITWNQNPVNLNKKVVTDELNISTSLTTTPGTFPLTITALSVNGSNSAQYVLTVNPEIPLTVSYSLSDGSLSQAPAISYVYNGITTVANLSSTGITIYADNGSTWKLNPISGNTQIQRWITNSTAQGVAKSAASINFFFYHQYSVNFQFLIGNGGNPPSAPSVKIYSVGTQVTSLANGSAVWVDALSAFSFSQLINYSTDRWVLSSNQTGLVTGAILESSTYIHQVLLKASLEIIGSGGGPISSKLSYQNLGKNATTQIDANQSYIWIDAGTRWTVPSILNGSQTGQRWIETNVNSSGLAQSAQIRYITQYYVSVGLNNPTAGAVPAIHGWFNASLPIALTAKANNGWKFMTWESNGQATPATSNSTTLMVTGPINETAVFWAGLQISSGANGHVNYNYGNVSGTVPASSSATLYLPPGTAVSLSALPDSAFYSSAAWSGDNQSSSASTQNFAVSAPATIGATYTLNVMSIAIVAVVLVGVVAAVAVIIAKRGGSKQFVDSSGHGWKW